MRRTTTLVALSLALVALALPQGRVTFQDAAGNMSLRGFRDFQVRNSGSEVRFSGTGAPLEGTWREQRIAMRGRRTEGTAVRAGRRMNLRSLTLSGKAWLQSLGTGRSSVVTAERIESTVQGSRTMVNLPVVFQLTETQTAPTNQTITLSGIRGTATLEGGDLRSANVTGPVTLSLVRMERGETTRLTVTGASLTAQLGPAGGTATVTGNVRVRGDGDTFSGEAFVRKATVRLGPDRRPVGVDLEGGAR